MGWSEIFLIGIVALIVVGPKDLPGMFRELGRFSTKIKGMAREFQRAMEDAADQSGVGDIGKTLRQVANPKAMGLDALNKATNWDDTSPKPKGPPVKDHSESMAKIHQVQAAAAQKAASQPVAEAGPDAAASTATAPTLAPAPTSTRAPTQAPTQAPVTSPAPQTAEPEAKS